MMLKRIIWASITVALALVPILTMDEPAQARMGKPEAVYVQRGEASWYGPGSHGRKTASGERFNQHNLTAAHRKLPLGTKATVINLEQRQDCRGRDQRPRPVCPRPHHRSVEGGRGTAGHEGAGTTLVRLEVTKAQARSS